MLHGLGHRARRRPDGAGRDQRLDGRQLGRPSPSAVVRALRAAGGVGADPRAEACCSLEARPSRRQLRRLTRGAAGAPRPAGPAPRWHNRRMSRAFLHIGAPKTGTTYLQDRLALNAADAGRARGALPDAAPSQPGAVPVPGRPRPARPGLGRRARATPRAPGTPSRAGSARRTGTVVVSHEILAPAAPGRRSPGSSATSAAAAPRCTSSTPRATSAGRCPAAWQESIKQGTGWTLPALPAAASSTGKAWFYRAFDLPDVLEAWCGGPAARAGARRDRAAPRARRTRTTTLWQRFCAAFGIDPAWAPRRQRPDQRLAGGGRDPAAAQAQQAAGPRHAARGGLRRADPRHAGRGPSWSSGESRPVRLPPGVLPVGRAGGRALDRVADRQRRRRRRRPRRPATAAARSEGERWVNPDKVRPRASCDAALDALAAMTGEAARRPDPDQRFVARVRSRRCERRCAGERARCTRRAPGLGLGGAPARRRDHAVVGLAGRGDTPARPAARPGRPAARAAAPAQPAPARPGAATLAERVLAASAPGRGRPDLELVGAVPPSRFGPRPGRPRRPPRRRAGPGRHRPARRGPRRRRARRPSRAAGAGCRALAAAPTAWSGDPWLADPLRAELVARGRPPGGRAPRGPGAGHRPRARCSPTPGRRAASTRAAPAWREWLDAAGHAAPAAAARRPASPRPRPGPSRVGAAGSGWSLDPTGCRRLVGVPPGAAAPPTLAADATELARRVAAALGLLVAAPPRGTSCSRMLLPRLTGPARLVGGRRAAAAPSPSGTGVGAGPGGAVRDELAAAGYPVHRRPGDACRRPGGVRLDRVPGTRRALRGGCAGPGGPAAARSEERPGSRSGGGAR